MILGSQQSVAGGLHLAFERCARDAGDALQIFSKSSRRWAARELDEPAIKQFERARARHTSKGFPVAAHASYLINLASAGSALYERSIAALVDECRRAARLGVNQVIVHPGACVGATRQEGVRRAAAALLRICQALKGSRVRLLIENTAGQGTCVGCTFEDLAEILQLVGSPRLGVCLDTQHLFAAGIDWTTPRGYRKTFERFERIVGMKYLEAFHLNDSKKALGARVDRHARIGDGLIGLAPFARLVRDERFKAIPGYLETPPLESGEDSFAQGLERLRSLL